MHSDEGGGDSDMYVYASEYKNRVVPCSIEVVER